jgi:Cytosine deaminase and related metal-dependent hydrolases
MSILIKGVDLLRDGKVLRDDILIEGNKIVEIGRVDCEADFKISGENRIAIPGLINMHTHLGLTLAKGLFDDVELGEFLRRTEEFDRNNKRDAIEKSAFYGIMEMLKTGTTTFFDYYYDEDVVEKVAQKMGIRAILAWAVLDDDKTTQKGSPLKNCENFLNKEGKKEGRIKRAIALQGVYACSDETILKAKDLANKKQTLIAMHLAESQVEVYSSMKACRKRPIERVASLNIIDKNFVAVHCVYVTKNELKELRKSTIVHCPSSNLKLADGIAPVPEAIEERIRVTIGTDSSATNNSLDMFNEMRLTALIHKCSHWDPTLMNYEKCIEMATVNGAKAIGINAGRIEENRLADLVLIDKRSIFPFRPSNLVYCTRQKVDCTIVNGKLLFEDGEFCDEIAEYGKKFKSK